MNFVQKYFAIIVIVGVIMAVSVPSIFVPLKPYITYLLAAIMLIIGLHLKAKDFIQVANLRWKLLVILFLKLVVISTAAFIVGKVFGLNLMALIGIVIVGTCPGGTASGVMALLARANISLVVSLTFLTTLLAPVFMPLIIYIFFSKSINLDWFGMFKTMAIIVILPIVLGILISKFTKLNESNLRKISNIPIFLIILIVIVVTALNKKTIMLVPIDIILSVIVLSTFANIFGYLVGKILGLDFESRLALLFEFSILDVGLGIVIALVFFGDQAAIAATFYAIWQNIVGPIIVNLINIRRNKR
ncbi:MULTISPECIES: bile acid:sodium symporter family protein [unclassified Francisella]|uniref:bile acid:sodium symporter family protein n=1 Tax=unclassified Francisella TaxID=2610885 RepID=UPI002E336AD7|nr:MULTISPECIES: bile acid:sodium symporter family protein [unclassified Francisella]MED7818727.1 bile acid:sodium symporter family protein [Francisella sp. 19S2-4]MED7829556.1 bile acid:sodium symporter family protein [Francisella sp. 19S2-10]